MDGAQMKKLLRVTTVTDKTTSNAVAILTQTNGAWTVGHTAPSLAWMRGQDMEAIKQRLTDDGAKWEWLPVSEQFAQVAQGQQPASRRPATATKPQRDVVVTAGEQLWFNGVQNAIKAEKRKSAIVRNVRGKRKKEVTDNAR
jgi:hypothetical protein